MKEDEEDYDEFDTEAETLGGQTALRPFQFKLNRKANNCQAGCYFNRRCLRTCHGRTRRTICKFVKSKRMCKFKHHRQFMILRAERINQNCGDVCNKDKKCLQNCGKDSKECGIRKDRRMCRFAK